MKLAFKKWVENIQTTAYNDAYNDLSNAYGRLFMDTFFKHNILSSASVA
jgi:hypothetical protein